MSTHGTMLNAPMIPPIPTSDISLTNIFKRTWQIDCFHFGTHTYYARLQGIRVRMHLYILIAFLISQSDPNAPFWRASARPMRASVWRFHLLSFTI